jgi:hypothetical protein
VSVRAKFTVFSIAPNGDGVEIDLIPVVTGSPENEQFYSFTPWGSIKLGTVNASAAEQFEVGKEYYVDFTKAGE